MAGLAVFRTLRLYLGNKSNYRARCVWSILFMSGKPVCVKGKCGSGPEFAAHGAGFFPGPPGPPCAKHLRTQGCFLHTLPVQLSASRGHFHCSGQCFRTAQRHFPALGGPAMRLSLRQIKRSHLVQGGSLIESSGAPGRIRTSDLQVRSLLLYPAGLLARGSAAKMSGAPGRIRTSDLQVRSLLLYPAGLLARVATREAYTRKHSCASRIF